MNSTEFYRKYKKTAERVEAQTGIPWEFLLAGWSWETAFGTNTTVKAKNLGGVKYTKNADYKSGRYSGYNTLDNFADDLSRIYKLRYYNEVRASGRKNDYKDVILAHNKSPYSESDYDVNVIKKRIDEIESLFNETTDNATEVIDLKNSANVKIEKMSNDELKKYAIIGLAIASAIALID